MRIDYNLWDPSTLGWSEAKAWDAFVRFYAGAEAEIGLAEPSPLAIAVVYIMPHRIGAGGRDILIELEIANRIEGCGHLNRGDIGWRRPANVGLSACYSPHSALPLLPQRTQ